MGFVRSGMNSKNLVNRFVWKQQQLAFGDASKRFTIGLYIAPSSGHSFLNFILFIFYWF